MADKLTRPAGEAASTPAPAAHHPLMTLRDEVDRLFDNFFPAAFGRSLFDLDPWRERPFRSLGGIAPQMDVKECANHYEISVELPGMDDKDVTVKVMGGMLTISGEKKAERTEENGEMHLTERSYGAFTRSVRLPENADPDTAKADYGKGVLTVAIGKRPDGAGEKKIEVTAH
ncbi:MAG: Hsp20/alpha crystallin family protein [Magnetospirillum sp.]|nr:Hsp20/alpha crystallin family protein [Magnetospirillum sp.]